MKTFSEHSFCQSPAQRRKDPSGLLPKTFYTCIGLLRKYSDSCFSQSFFTIKSQNKISCTNSSPNLQSSISNKLQDICNCMFHFYLSLNVCKINQIHPFPSCNQRLFLHCLFFLTPKIKILMMSPGLTLYFAPPTESRPVKYLEEPLAHTWN